MSVPGTDFATGRKETGLMDQIVSIVILAMVAAFLGMRLYSVLGRRAEHEEESIPTRFDPTAQPKPQAEDDQPSQPANQGQFRAQPMSDVIPAVEQGVRAIASADRRFDITAFLEGAKGAYAVVLEAFWQGDRETLRELCDDDVYASFDAAIAMREESGEQVDNRLVRIEDAVIDRAELDGRTARVAVRFLSDIAMITRDKDGTMIAGSLDDAIESRDIWTFSRDVKADDPNWLLDETDQG